MIYGFAILTCITFAAFVLLAHTHKKMADYRILVHAVRGISKFEHAGLDPAVDRRLKAQFNRNLNVILTQFRIVEQRGLDWEKALDSVPDSICIIDESAKIVRANLSFSNRVSN